ncbi:MAG: protein GlmU, partial [Desulfobacterales bacterium]|nr:protein GlmU [Desulfobacterales bacterium]
AHVRAGTIFEEQARCAHTVGLKQTILFPFVTLGSLINFCDIFMSGGTTAKDHSEVGSSYIHFNYTPNQDKATASLIGDVPRGVMLDQPPIFLGGQGGLVGPCALAFGTTVAAGSICRKDEKKPGRLIIAGAARSGRVPFSPGVYRGCKRIVRHNINYIANLLALRQWYGHVRSLFISDRYPEALARGLEDTLDAGINERLKQFKAFCLKMPASIELLTAGSTTEPPGTQVQQQQELFDRCTDVETTLLAGAQFAGDIGSRDRFLEHVNAAIQTGEKDYIAVITALSENEKKEGTGWLQSIADQAAAAALDHLPLLV